jgi:hypothetical protein
MMNMKTLMTMLGTGVLLVAFDSLAQLPLPPPGRLSFPVPSPTDPPKPTELRFDLDFPGGTPGQLVKAIEKSAGKPLNVIIPDEFAQEPLPALRMNAVSVRELFQALERSSQKSVRYVSGTYQGPGGIPQVQYGQSTTTFGFATQGPQEYQSIWCFFKVGPPDADEPKVCRFYNLAPYLETYKVDDITTAVETGQKLLGEHSPLPMPWQKSKIIMNFHKDTKLLIVVGNPIQLKLVDSVLEELSPNKAALNTGHTAGRAVPAERK